MAFFDIGIRLEEDDVCEHLHGWGDPGSGKSKCIECILRQLIDKDYGVAFLDPHGSTIIDILKRLAFYRPKRPVHYLDTSSRYSPGFTLNAAAKDHDELMSHVEQMVVGICRVCGYKNTNETPRLAKFLRAILYVIAALDLPPESCPAETKAGATAVEQQV